MPTPFSKDEWLNWYCSLKKPQRVIVLRALSKLTKDGMKWSTAAHLIQNGLKDIEQKLEP